MSPTGSSVEARTTVGPVVTRGPVGEAVLAVLRALNPDAQFVDRGAYVRVLCPGRCRLERAAVEAVALRPFRLPGDLEGVMPSFKGRFRVTDEEAVWEAAPQAIAGKGRS